MLTHIKRSFAAVAIAGASILGLGTGVANAVLLPYAYYPTERGCLDAGLDLQDEGATNFFSCKLERNDLWHLFIDE